MIDALSEYERYPWSKRVGLWVKYRPASLFRASLQSIVWILNGCKPATYDLEDGKFSFSRWVTFKTIWTLEKGRAQFAMKHYYTMEQLFERLK